MSRIPVIATSRLAQRVASIYCDDESHYTSEGEPKFLPGAAILQRENCQHTRKVLLRDKNGGRFCIVHDHGVGFNVSPSGQWWALDSAGIEEIDRALVEYWRLMRGEVPWSNWWENIGHELGGIEISPTAKLTAGLRNEVSKGSPATEPNRAKDEATGARCAEISASRISLEDSEGDWELVESAEIEDDFELVKEPRRVRVMG